MGNNSESVDILISLKGVKAAGDDVRELASRFGELGPVLANLSGIGFFSDLTSQAMGLSSAIGSIKSALVGLGGIGGAAGVVALGTIAATMKAASEAYGLFQAKLAERTTGADASTVGLKTGVAFGHAQNQIKQLIDESERLKELTPDNAKFFRSIIPKKEDFEQDASAAINAMAKLYKMVENSRYYDNTKEASNQRLISEAETAKQIGAIRSDNIKASLEDEFQNRRKSLEDYLNVQRELVTQARDKELDVITAKESDARFKRTKTYDKAEQLALMKQLDELAGQRKIAEETLQRELTQIDLSEDQKRLSLLIEQTDRKNRELRLRQTDVAIKQAEVQGNFRLTDNDKREKSIALQKEENDLIDQQIKSLEELKLKQTDANSKQFLDQSIVQLTNRSRTGKASVAQQEGAANLGSFSDQFDVELAKVQNSWGSWAHQAAGELTSVFKTATDSISAGITGLIMGTKSWGSALREIYTSIATKFVGSFVSMGVEWVNVHVVMAGISSLFRVKETAETAAHTSAQVGIHTAGETAKTGSTAGGALARGALRVGETIFHGIQVAFRVATHIAGEIAQTVATIIQSTIRIGKLIIESGIYIIRAAVAAMSAVASIPYVGPVLAVAALAGIIAAGYSALKGAQGREHGGPVAAGETYLVGERGPELHVSKRDGYIINNTRTMAMMSAGAGSSRGVGGGGSGGSASTGAGSSLHQSINIFHDKRQWLNACRDDIAAIALDTMKKNSWNTRS